MPKIVLKPNSPEYADGAAKAKGRTRSCDMPGCADAGEFRAPKDRSLTEYHWFCQEHIREYNTAWDFFSGMATRDVEDHIIQSLYGDRPTRRTDTYRGFEAELQRKIREMWHFEEIKPDPEVNMNARPTGNPELDALNIMGLSAPVTFATIKTRYRELVKKYHPDHNRHDPAAEELIKQVNMAYTILKMSFGNDARATFYTD